MDSSWWTDLRLGGRQWRKRPAPIVAALVVLAVGIGANVAVFSVAHAVLLRPLPYDAPERLVQLSPERPVSRAMLDVFRRDGRGFVDVSAYDSSRVTLTGEGEPETLFGMSVSTHHFELLGVQPLHGRTFRPEESEPARGRSVILTHELWRSRFGGDPRVLGDTIEVDDVAREIVGVLPASFRPLRRDVRLYLPLEIDPASDEYAGARFLELVARLDGDHDLVHARDETRRLLAQIRAEDPAMMLEEEILEASAIGLHEAQSGEARGGVVVLAAVTALILLAACANVAHLLLAQAAGRRRDMAVRAALGAGTCRLVRQLLVESLLLGGVGGLLGVGLAKLCLDLLVRRMVEAAPQLADAGLSPPVLGVSVALSLLAAVVFGTAPALRLARVDLRGTLHEGGRGEVGGRQRLGQALVATQVAASMVLLVGAGLFLRSLDALHRVDLGLATEQRLTAQIVPSPVRYADEDSQRLLWQRLLDTLEAQPWVESVAAVQALPLTGSRWIFPVYRQDRPPAADAGRPVARLATVNEAFFDALDIPLLAGRRFEPGDDADAELAVIVDEAYAREVFGGEDPLGRVLQVYDAEGPQLRIVGIAGTVRHDGPVDPAPGMLYLPIRQWPNRVLNVTLETTPAPNGRGDVTRWADELRAAVWSIEPDAPVSAIRSYDAIRAEATFAPRMLARLLGLFAAVALALAAAGLYGVLAQLVAARRRELGVRLALGASRRDIELDVLGRSARLVVAGLAVGAVGAWALGRLAASQLHQVSPAEPTAWLTAAATLALLALAGAWLPARRAGRVDPATVLRAD